MSPAALAGQARAAKELLDAGRFAAAMKIYQAVSRDHPDNAQAALMVGLCRARLGQRDQALRQYREVTRRWPTFLPGYFNLGNLYAEQRLWPQAQEAYQRCLALDPGLWAAYVQLVQILTHLGQASAAAELLDTARQRLPYQADRWRDLGDLQAQAGDLTGAIRTYRELADRQGDAGWLLGNLGSLLAQAGQAEDAAAVLTRAAGLPDADALSHYNLVHALLLLDRLQDAQVHAQRALDQFPLQPAAQLAWASVSAVRGDFAAAESALARMAELSPDPRLPAEAQARLSPPWPDSFPIPWVAGGLYAAWWLEQIERCDWREYTRKRERLASLVPVADPIPPSAPPLAPFDALILPVSPAARLTLAKQYSRALQDYMNPWRQPAAPAGRHPAKGPLRVGYCSPDFRDHPIGHLARDLFRLHDRSHVRAFAYDLHPPDHDGFIRSMGLGQGQYRNLAALSNREAARRIAADGIQILVDLCGYTRYNRAEILALRPAPIQISSMGFPGSMGADFMDYLIGSELLIPPEHEGLYSEKILRLPDAHNLVSGWPQPGDPGPRSRWGLPDQGPVLASFNSYYKIEPQVFDIWMGLLRDFPDTRLWLLAETPDVRRRLVAEAGSRGVAPEQIIFAGRVSPQEHLTRLGLADLYLDTLVYSAFTTLSMALWAGVPVLACLGDGYASRMGAVAVATAGLPDLVAADPRAYQQLARELLQDPARLAGLRARLKDQGPHNRLFDKHRYLAHLESGYRLIWDRHLSGAAPDHIRVPALDLSPAGGRPR